MTTYHERIISALCAAHHANSLPITFGGKLLANHAGPADPGFISLVSLYTAKMHTLNTTESQYNKTLVQLPLLKQVFRNSADWEATCKDKGGAYVAEGLKQTVARDMSKVKCYECNKMGHYFSDCPQQQSSSKSDTVSSKKKKKKFIKWREVAPASGSPTTLTIETNVVTQTYHWCTKCRNGRGLWSTSHTNETHTGQRPSATADATPAAAFTLMELSDGGFYCH